MGFVEKINENHRILKKCLALSAYNVGASRAYYCVFTQIKKYLIAKNFNYEAFLEEINKPWERKFSHGTIKEAVVKVLLQDKEMDLNISNINVIDNLYYKRRKADYTERNISKKEFEDSINEMRKIEEILKNAETRAV